MKAKIHEQLSALVDHELQEQEQSLLFRQLEMDGELSARLSRYQLISDTLQNHLPAKLDNGFHKRIRDALPDGPPEPSSARASISSLLKPVAGLAVAASVAVVAVLSLQTVRDTGQDTAQAVASAPAPLKENYIRANTGNAALSASPADVTQSLEIYLVNHSEFAPSRGMLPYVRLVGHEMNADSRK